MNDLANSDINQPDNTSEDLESVSDEGIGATLDEEANTFEPEEDPEAQG